jgi:hypothetical protein
LHTLLKRKSQIIVFPLARFCAAAISKFAIIPACKLKIPILATAGRASRSVPALRYAIAVIGRPHNAQIISEIAILRDGLQIEFVVTFFNPATIRPDLDITRGYILTLEMRLR